MIDGDRRNTLLLDWKYREWVKPEHRSMAALKAVDAHTIPWALDGYLCHLDLSEETSSTNRQQDDCTVS